MDTYESLKRSFDINYYYESWKLRGDDPECYIDGYFKPKIFFGNEWNLYQINNTDTENNKRYDFETALLYHLYHYSSRVKIEGNRHIEIKVPWRLIETVELVQKELQRKVATLGVGIEANPSSNYHIGTFKRYDKHPITIFYNIGLVYDEKQLRQCPQISVSINTDDQGVFATSLENEYALILLALEKMRNKYGELCYSRELIYKWINNIREHGIKQSFMRNARNAE